MRKSGTRIKQKLRYSLGVANGPRYKTSHTLKLRENGRNNSQHCAANNVGSCCVHVGSGVQTDATIPNNV